MEELIKKAKQLGVEFDKSDTENILKLKIELAESKNELSEQNKIIEEQSNVLSKQERLLEDAILKPRVEHDGVDYEVMYPKVVVNPKIVLKAIKQRNLKTSLKFSEKELGKILVIDSEDLSNYPDLIDYFVKSESKLLKPIK